MKTETPQVKQPRRWTRRKPTTPGNYPFRSSMKVEPHTVIVDLLTDILVVRWTGEIEPVGLLNGLWLLEVAN